MGDIEIDTKVPLKSSSSFFEKQLQIYYYSLYFSPSITPAKPRDLRGKEIDLSIGSIKMCLHVM